MANDLLLRGVAFAVFLVLMGGSTYGAYQYIDADAITPRGLVVDPVERALTVAPGQLVSLAFVVKNGGGANESVRLKAEGAGIGAAESDAFDVGGGVASGGWVVLDLPEGLAAGKLPVTVVAETAAEPVRRATTTVTLDVLPPGEGLKAGDSAAVAYVGRLGDGRIFNDNVQAYIDAPLPRTDFYRASGELSVTTGAQANVITGFWEGMIGMRVGETRTIVIPPEDAYGPKQVEETVPRTSSVDRIFEMQVEPITRPYRSFGDHIAQTGQGNPADYEAGDTFLFEQGSNKWTFLLTNVSEESVTYVPAPEVGDLFTLPSSEMWPNSSRVVSANDSMVVFETTPTTEIGEGFTFFEYWPDFSAVTSVNETSILVTHSPPVGYEFDVPSPGGRGGPRHYTILEVAEDSILEAYDSPNPLAGETLVFNVRILKVTSEAAS